MSQMFFKGGRQCAALRWQMVLMNEGLATGLVGYKLHHGCALIESFRKNFDLSRNCVE